MSRKEQRSRNKKRAGQAGARAGRREFSLRISGSHQGMERMTNIPMRPSAIIPPIIMKTILKPLFCSV